MASIVASPGSMSLRMDTGEMDGGRAVYKTASFGNIKGTANADALAAIAAAAEKALRWPVDQVTLRRTETLIYQTD